MTSQHRIGRLRVAAPTLEPDPVFLDMLAVRGAKSRPAAPRTARSAGLRMIAATASVAVMAAATWAADTNVGEETPLSPAAGPARQETSAPSPGLVGTPQSDESTSPGSPTTPGLPGTTSPDPRKGVDDGDRPRPGAKKGKAHKPGKKARPRRPGFVHKRNAPVPPAAYPGHGPGYGFTPPSYGSGWRQQPHDSAGSGSARSFKGSDSRRRSGKGRNGRNGGGPAHTGSPRNR